jgi:hypothetical protein
MNDRLKRVRVKEDKKVPIEKLDIWYLLIKEDGSWDAGQSNEDDFAKELKDEKTIHVFAIWHGQWRTDLFLMDKKELIKKFKKLGFYTFQDVKRGVKR